MIDYLHGVELTPLRRLLFTGAFAGGKEVEDTATGNPLTFLTDLARPLKELLVSWTPTQSGSGDPSPENVRPISGMSGVNVTHCGKNIFDKSMEKDNGHYYNDSGSYENSTTSGFFTGYIPVNPSTKYTISGSIRNAIYCYDSSKGWISKIGAEDAPRTFTTPTGCKFIRVQYRIEDLDANTVQIEVGETATAYSPYVGESYPVTFPATGKNLLNPAWWDDVTSQLENISWVSYLDGTLHAQSNSHKASDYVSVIGNTEYTLHAGMNAQNDAGIAFYDANKQYISGLQMKSATKKDYTFTTPVNAVYMRFSDLNTIVPFDEVMLVLGSTAPTAYEPYTSTIYGGSLDLVTGVLTAEWKMVDMGSLNYVMYGETSSRQTWQFALDANYPTDGSKPLDAISSKFKQVNRTSVWSPNTMSWTSTGSLNYGIVNFAPGAYENGNAVKTAMEGTQLCYLLKTPLTYQLTPQQITALIGDNTIWADANGNCEVTYLKKG